MSLRRLWSSGDVSRGDARPRQFYECTYCQVNLDEWAEDCPQCGQLVVRVVEPPG